MDKTTTNILPLISYSKGGIVSKELMKDAQGNVTLFCMAAGTSMSEHTATKQGIAYVVEGEGNFCLEGKEIAMKPGVVIAMAKDAEHSLAATKDTAFLLILTK